MKVMSMSKLMKIFISNNAVLEQITQEIAIMKKLVSLLFLTSRTTQTS